MLAFDTEAWQHSFAAGGGAAGGGEGTAAGEGAPFTEGEALMGAREACVEQGGPEAAAAHPDRALVLTWPEYDGRGSYGLACLRAYRGDRLVLVGEWRVARPSAAAAAPRAASPSRPSSSGRWRPDL